MTETDPPSSGPRVRSRWPGRLLRTALVIACLAYALWNVDPTSLLETLADIDPLRVLLVMRLLPGSLRLLTRFTILIRARFWTLRV